MPLAKPHPHETKTTFLSRCYAHQNTRKEFGDDNNQIGGYCYTAWKEHKAKASYVIVAGDEEYAVFPPDAKKDQLPDDKRKLPSNDQIQKDSEKPMPHLGPDEGGPIPPPQKPVAETQTPPSDDSDKPVKVSENPGDSPDLYDEVDVQAKTGHEPRDSDIQERKKHAGDPPKDQYPNLNEGGPSSAPNPDNSTVDSLDDKSAKPKIEDTQWFMASDTYAYAIDPETGLAKWPLRFKRIEKDFKRPNKIKDPNAEPKVNQADPKVGLKIAEKDNPYGVSVKG